MQFRATLLLTGRTATGVEVPLPVVEALGAGRKPPVRVTVNGYTYRSSIAFMYGVFMLGFSDEVRRGAGIAAGDELDIEVQLDTEPREVSVPEDFAAVLAADAEASRVFDALSYSGRLRYVLAIGDAKTPETRQRRIEKSVAELHAGGPKR
jgi:Bacteriocin-protection, YdeI or OmpD-Associated/Domain of unknown function (DUF1905)